MTSTDPAQQVRTEPENRRLLWILIGAATVLRLYLSWFYPGFLTGDDVELVEAGFRRAFDFAYHPWEIRNLLLPELVIAPVLWLSASVGVTSSAALVWLCHLPFVAFGSLCGWLVYRLAVVWGFGERSAVAAAGIYLAMPLALAYSSSVYPRVAATACLLGAAILCSRIYSTRYRSLVLAGLLLAVAFACRYSEGIYLLPLTICSMLGSNRDEAIRRALLLIASYGGFVLLTVGLMDYVTWGTPFASLMNFYEYTLVDKLSSAAETNQPFFHYLRRLPHWLPIPLLPLVVLGGRHRRAWHVVAFVVLPLLVLSYIHNKQLRYLQGIVPFVAILSAIGFRDLLRIERRKLAWSLLVLGVLLGIGKGVSTVQKKSGAAVEAARYLADRDLSKPVLLSQAWAYGDRLYLGGDAPVVPLGTPPSREELEAKLPTAAWAALYVKDVERHEWIEPLLTERGFTQAQRFSPHHEKSVALYQLE